jgi:cellulose synthase operon protein C
MIDTANFDADWLLKIARYQLEAGYREDSAYTLNKTVQDKPDNIPGLLNLALIEMDLGRLDSAFEHSEALVKLKPNDAVGYQVRGEVRMRRDDFAGAIEDFRRAITQAPDSEQAAAALHMAEFRAGDLPGAEITVDQWVTQHPKSLAGKAAQAEFYARTGRHDRAQELFSALVKAQPGNASVLNNYANVLHKLKDPTALDIARQAHAAAPTDPAVNDTLGWLLVSSGKTEEGLSYLRDAQARAATQREIQFHVAAALNALGRVDEARRELSEALASKEAFEGRDEAMALLRKIGR